MQQDVRYMAGLMYLSRRTAPCDFQSLWAAVVKQGMTHASIFAMHDSSIAEQTETGMVAVESVGIAHQYACDYVKA